MKNKIAALVVATVLFTGSVFAQTTADIKNFGGNLLITGKTEAGVTVTLTVKSADDESGIYAIKETVSDSDGNFSFDFILRDREVSQDISRYIIKIKGDSLFEKEISVYSSDIVSELIDNIKSGSAETLYLVLEDGEKADICINIGMDISKYKVLSEADRHRLCRAFYDDADMALIDEDTIANLFNLEVVLFATKDLESESYLSQMSEAFGWNELSEFTLKRLEETREYNNISELKSEIEAFEILNKINNAKYTELEKIFLENEELLALNYNDEYVRYKGLNSSMKRQANEKVVSALLKTPAQTIEDFTAVFEECVSSIKESQASSGGSSGGGSVGSYPGGKGSTQDSGSVVVNDNTNMELPEKEPAFSDVSRDFWAFESIEQLADSEIINGYSDGTFRPDNSITREEFITILVNALGIYNGTSKCNFEDVSEDDWFYKFVSSGYEAGVVSGISQTLFGKGMEITRQDVAVMIARALQLEANSGYELFYDDDEIAEYAKQSVYALKEKSIISGREGNVFVPAGKCTRAECAVMIKKAMDIG